MILHATTCRLYENLALEEVLLEQAPAPSLLFWAAGPSVVIGRNQNPWKECHLCLMRARGIPLARRCSGGGAVFHDSGNLNISFVLEREGYRKEDITALLADALGDLGCAIEPIGRDGLGTAGRKLTGQAFCMRRGRVLHHATLLINADLALLDECLKPTGPAIRDRCIASARSPVVNLQTALPGITRDRVERAVARRYRAALAPEDKPAPIREPWRTSARRKAPELAAWEYRYGHTPRFGVDLPAPAGTLHAIVHRGRIENIRCAGSFPSERITAALVGRRLAAPDLEASLAAAGAPPEWRQWAAELPY
jgi:lipoate-protein ligase A